MTSANDVSFVIDMNGKGLQVDVAGAIVVDCRKLQKPLTPDTVVTVLIHLSQATTTAQTKSRRGGIDEDVPRERQFVKNGNR